MYDFQQEKLFIDQLLRVVYMSAYYQSAFYSLNETGVYIMAEMFEVRGARPNAGISKNTGKPYKFVSFSGLLTDAHGNMSAGEVTIFEYENRPIPNIEVGKVYALSYASRVRQGKIEASNPQLTLVK